MPLVTYTSLLVIRFYVNTRKIWPPQIANFLGLWVWKAFGKTDIRNDTNSK